MIPLQFLSHRSIVTSVLSRGAETRLTVESQGRGLPFL